jgi:hypothetical protein
MNEQTLVALLAFLIFGMFVFLPIALFLYRVGGLTLDPWIWLFTGKRPGRKPKKVPPKNTDQPSEHP